MPEQTKLKKHTDALPKKCTLIEIQMTQLPLTNFKSWVQPMKLYQILTKEKFMTEVAKRLYKKTGKGVVEATLFQGKSHTVQNFNSFSIMFYTKLLPPHTYWRPVLPCYISGLSHSAVCLTENLVKCYLLKNCHLMSSKN